MDYLDLYLMHWPVAFNYHSDAEKFPKVNEKLDLDEALSEDQSSTWKEMENLVHAGLVRDIGISNFSIPRIERLLKSATIKPAVNQVELHPINAQPELLKFCTEKGIHLTAYSPLGAEGSTLLTNTKITDLAEKKGVDAGRVLIAWALGRGTSVIPKSVTEARIISNFQAVDVKFTTDEMAVLDGMDEGKRFVDPSKAWGIDIYT